MFKWHPFRCNVRRLLLEPLYQPFLKFFRFELRYLGIQGPSTHNANVGPSETLYCHQENVSRYVVEGDVCYKPTPVSMSSSLRWTRCTLCPWRCWTILHATLTCTVTSLDSLRRRLKTVDTAVLKMPRWLNGSNRNGVTLWREAIGWWVSGNPIWTPMGLF